MPSFCRVFDLRARAAAERRTAGEVRTANSASTDRQAKKTNFCADTGAGTRADLNFLFIRGVPGIAAKITGNSPEDRPNSGSSIAAKTEERAASASEATGLRRSIAI